MESILDGGGGGDRGWSWSWNASRQRVHDDGKDEVGA